MTDEPEPDSEEPSGFTHAAGGGFDGPQPNAYQPGESGNPGGVRKDGNPKHAGRWISRIIRDMLQENDSQVVRDIVSRQIRAAKGKRGIFDQGVWNQLMERAEGKVVDEVKMDVTQKVKKVQFEDDELDELDVAPSEIKKKGEGE